MLLMVKTIRRKNSSKTGENFAKKGWRGQNALLSLAVQIV
jgi:hypothetical protein